MSARVLIAGVGNVLLGDDGFGVEVARRLAAERLPPGVAVIDFGIRGVHLAFELLDAPELLILVDTASRGEIPGTVSVLVPDLDGGPRPPAADAHGMDLPAVFAQVRAMGGTLPPTLLVGCEPADLEEHIGLSAPVQAAVGPAMRLVRDLAERELARGRSMTEGAEP